MAKVKNVPWKIRDIVNVIFIVMLLFILSKLMLSYLGIEKIYETTNYKSWIILGIYIMQILIITIPLILFTVVKYGSKIRDFGFNKVKIRKLILGVIMAYLAFIGFGILISIFSFLTGTEIPGFQEQEEILPLFGEDPFSLIIAFIVIVVIAPIFEEIFFRGYVLQTLIKKVNVYWGSIITALFFSFVHFEFQIFLSIFVLAIIINWLFIRFKSIWPCVAFHTLNNLITFLVVINYS